MNDERTKMRRFKYTRWQIMTNLIKNALLFDWTFLYIMHDIATDKTILHSGRFLSKHVNKIRIFVSCSYS